VATTSRLPKVESLCSHELVGAMHYRVATTSRLRKVESLCSHELVRANALWDDND